MGFAGIGLTSQLHCHMIPQINQAKIGLKRNTTGAIIAPPPIGNRVKKMKSTFTHPPSNIYFLMLTFVHGSLSLTGFLHFQSGYDLTDLSLNHCVNATAIEMNKLY